MPSKKIMDEIRALSEKYFKTKEDPTEIQASVETENKFFKQHPKSVLCKLDQDGHVASWVAVLPTSKALAKKFVEGKINERQLLKLSRARKMYSALYFCAAVTVSKYRRHGFAKELFIKAYKSIPHTKNCYCCYWPVSESGRKLALEIAKKLNIEMNIRNA